jgi:hypothetical protein
MATTPEYELFLAPESAVAAAIDDELDAGSDAYADPADDFLDGLAGGGLYDEGVERHVREILGRVYGL